MNRFPETTSYILVVSLDPAARGGEMFLLRTFYGQTNEVS